MKNILISILTTAIIIGSASICFSADENTPLKEMETYYLLDTGYTRPYSKQDLDLAEYLIKKEVSKTMTKGGVTDDVIQLSLSTVKIDSPGKSIIKLGDDTFLHIVQIQGLAGKTGTYGIIYAPKLISGEALEKLKPLVRDAAQKATIITNNKTKKLLEIGK